MRLWYLHRVVGTLVRALGAEAATRAARAMAGGIFRLKLPVRRQIEANLRRAFGSSLSHAAGERLARGVFENTAAFWIEAAYVGRLLRPSGWQDRVHVADSAGWPALAASPRPVVFVTTYIGNPLVAACALSELAGPLKVPADPVSRLLIRATGGVPRGFRHLHLIDSRDLRSPAALRATERLLVLGGAEPQYGGVTCPFLGRSRHHHASIARLALRSGAEIAVMACLRREHQPFRFDLELWDRIRPPARSAVALTSRYLHVLDAGIRRHAEQFLWTRA